MTPFTIGGVRLPVRRGVRWSGLNKFVIKRDLESSGGQCDSYFH